MAQLVRSMTLIHGVVGSNLAVTLSVLPKEWGLDDGTSGIGQAKSRPTKSDLHMGKFHCADYCLMRPCTLKPPGVRARLKCDIVHFFRFEDFSLSVPKSACKGYTNTALISCELPSHTAINICFKPNQPLI